VRVAVAALSNETGDTTLAPLGSMVASWITDRLSRTPGVRVITSAIVVPAQHDQHVAGSDADDPMWLHILATETRAGTLVSGSYYRRAQGGVEFHVEITDANSGRLLRAIGPITGVGEPARVAGELSAAVAAAVDTLVADPGFPTR
jgi:TolB-like protein